MSVSQLSQAAPATPFTPIPTEETATSKRRHDERREMIAAGRFTKGKLIGRGANGVVYTAILENGSSVALKETCLSGSEDEIRVQLIEARKEIDLLANIQHPNLVPYYGLKEIAEHGKLLIFTELVAGGSLAATVKGLHDALSERTLRRYAIQILNGLVALHERRIVHRDLKGENVFFDSDSGLVKIGDFGTARMLATIHASVGAQTMVGTPYCMAPEVLVGTNNGDEDVDGYGVKADIWSFGILMLELLNKGRPPWPEFSNPGQAFMHIANPRNTPTISDFGRLSPMCQDFITSCVHRDPQKRPSANELKEHLWIKSYEGSFSSVFL